MKRKKMSRLLIAASLCLALIFTYSAGALAVQALAADPTLPTVTLTASSSQAQFTFNRPKQAEPKVKTAMLAEGTHDTTVDLFDNFKNVMPGDHLTQTIRVQAAVGNDSSYKIYLYARVCGDNTDANKAFLNAMALTVSQGANKLDVLNAGKDAQGIYLGTFAQGTGEDLTVDLQVPIEMGNEFQNAECYVDWYFYAEQVTGGSSGGGDDDPSQTPTTSEPGTTPTATPSEPIPSAVPSPAPSADPGEGDIVIDEGDVPAGELPDIEIDEEGVPMGDMPQTGDETNLPLLLTTMVASGSALGGILIFGRKRESDESK